MWFHYLIFMKMYIYNDLCDNALKCSKIYGQTEYIKLCENNTNSSLIFQYIIAHEICLINHLNHVIPPSFFP